MCVAWLDCMCDGTVELLTEELGAWSEACDSILYVFEWKGDRRFDSLQATLLRF